MSTQSPPSEARSGGGRPPTPTWTCPACEHPNPLELDRCERCGTSFAVYMHQDDEPLPDVAPRDAVLWSLVFPGLGHRRLGHGLEGLARGVLFAMVLAMTVITGLSVTSSPAFTGVFVLFLVMTVVVYAGSAYEAAQMADGAGPIVSARALMWVTVGVILISVALLAVTVAMVAKR